MEVPICMHKGTSSRVFPITEAACTIPRSLVPPSSQLRPRARLGLLLPRPVLYRNLTFCKISECPVNMPRREEGRPTIKGSYGAPPPFSFSFFPFPSFHRLFADPCNMQVTVALKERENRNPLGHWLSRIEALRSLRNHLSGDATLSAL